MKSYIKILKELSDAYDKAALNHNHWIAAICSDHGGSDQYADYVEAKRLTDRIKDLEKELYAALDKKLNG